MTRVFSSLILALAWFGTVNALASTVAWLVARIDERCRRADRPGVLLTTRLFPAISSLCFVVIMFLPAHWRLEPVSIQESFGLTVWLLAAVSALLVARSLWRAILIVRASRRLGAWARSQNACGADVPSEVPGLAGISLAGVFRTHVLVGRSARTALTAPELDVAIAHELAHRRSRDNVKRFAIICAPDLFGWSAVARRLEERWRANAECLADARAVRGDAVRALHLASALVKVARLADNAVGRRAPTLWSAFHEPALLEARVRKLVCGVPDISPRSRVAGLAAASLLTGSAAAWLVGVPFELHRLTETLVMLLP